jgi:trans-aconitate methyltransferase
MEISEATAMLKNDKIRFQEIEQWADLGCGSGTFTRALATLLQPQSIIHAVDSNNTSLNQIPSSYHSVQIEKQRIDFVSENLNLKNLDGILMANSLHYVRDKKSLVIKLSSSLKQHGSFLFVEYDTENPIPKWVPYPISFSSLKKLFTDIGYRDIQKLQERKSVFGQMMYSAVIKN